VNCSVFETSIWAKLNNSAMRLAVLQELEDNMALQQGRVDDDSNGRTIVDVELEDCVCGYYDGDKYSNYIFINTKYLEDSSKNYVVMDTIIHE